MMGGEKFHYLTRSFFYLKRVVANQLINLDVLITKQADIPLLFWCVRSRESVGQPHVIIHYGCCVSGETPLHTACIKGDIDRVTSLLNDQSELYIIPAG